MTLGPRVRSRAVLAACLAASALLVTAPAFAQPASEAADELPAEVSLAQDTCAKELYAQDALVPLLRMELAALGVRALVPGDAAAAAPAFAFAYVSVVCAPNHGLVLRLADLATKKRTEREMSVADVPTQARPRAIAIAIVELIESSWTELLTSPASLVSSGDDSWQLPMPVQERLRAHLADALAVRAPFDAPTSSVPADTFARHAQLSMTTRAFPTHSTSLLGARLGYEARLNRRPVPLVLSLDAELLRGGADLQDATGRVGGIAFTWLTSAVRLGFQSRASPGLSVGPSLRFGYGAVSVQAERASVSVRDAHHALASVGAYAELRVDLSRRFAGLLGAELGYMVWGTALLADRTRVAGLSDATFALSIGTAFAF